MPPTNRLTGPLNDSNRPLKKQPKTPARHSKSHNAALLALQPPADSQKQPTRRAIKPSENTVSKTLDDYVAKLFEDNQQFKTKSIFRRLIATFQWIKQKLNTGYSINQQQIIEYSDSITNLRYYEQYDDASKPQINTIKNLLSEKIGYLAVALLRPFDNQIQSINQKIEGLQKKRSGSIKVKESSIHSIQNEIDELNKSMSNSLRGESEPTTKTCNDLYSKKINDLESKLRALNEQITPSSTPATEAPLPLDIAEATDKIGPFVITLSETFITLSGTEFAKETVELVNTKSLLLKQIKSKIKYLNKTVGYTDRETDIARLNRQLKLYESQQGTWASSNAPRNVFKMNSGNPKRAKIEYPPVLGNLWMQQVKRCQSATTLSSVARSAAISDFMHSRVSLKELDDYSTLKMMANGTLQPEVSETAKAKELLALYSLGSESKPTKLGTKTTKALKKLVKELEKAIIQDYGIQAQGDALGDALKSTAVDKIKKERAEKLSTQVLQDLYVHFKTNPVKNDNVIYGRTGLVAPTKKMKNETAKNEQDGFINSERTQVLDMAAIYETLDGRSIIFDVEDEPEGGPYLDNDGNIHMNKSFDQRVESRKKPAELHAVFLNMSITGGAANVGMQKAINARGMAKLEALADSDLIDKNRLEELKNCLNDESSPSFENSNLSIHLFKEAGYASVNCFAGKDRTGYALALQTQDALEQSLKMIGSDQTYPLQEQLIDWGHQLVSENGLASQVIKYNTGYRTMKLRPIGLKLYNTTRFTIKKFRVKNFKRGSLKGNYLRFEDGIKGLLIKFKPKEISSEIGKGQLYSQ